MKEKIKKLLPALLIVATIALIISCCFISCRNDAEDENGSSTETGTLENASHLSPSESEEASSEPTSETAENDNQTTIESKTEATETTEEISSSQITTEETETETETETEIIVISLDYASFGNGTCAVVGIGNCTDVCVIIPEKSPTGDIVTAICEKAFYENTEIKAVQIPSTVTEIGNLAFGGCTSLVYVSVDSKNRAFCDVEGILFNLSKTELIAYPAANGATKLDISTEIEKIHDMAFYRSDNLELINYAGTLEDWGKIKIGASNYGLYTASIYCSDYKK